MVSSNNSPEGRSLPNGGEFVTKDNISPKHIWAVGMTQHI